MEITINSIFKSYNFGANNTEDVLNGISLSLYTGEFLSIFGPSGCGKSTLLNIISGLDTDYEGQILYGPKQITGLNSNDLADFRRDNVGFVFQNFNLLPELTVQDNLMTALYLRNGDMKTKAHRIESILTRLGILQLANKMPNEISGGQKQRVAIARALLNDPKVIIADEPTGALDKNSQATVLKILRELADEGKAVIVVTHNAEVANFSDRIIEIEDGFLLTEQVLAK
ncbi:MAG: ABC transporter ATP-binding protein [Micrococcaceae bacterium]